MATKTKKKAVAKKVAKKAPVKKATKPATKKAVKKGTKAATKKATKSSTKNASSNKELNAMLKTIEKAKKAKETSVVAYTTKKEDHPNATGGGFGFQDLKPSLQQAYNQLVCKFNNKFRTNLVNASNMAVEWIVDL